MQQIKAFGFDLKFADYSDILELINKDSRGLGEKVHIVSLNPETWFDLKNNDEYRKVVAKAQYVIADGVGIVTAIQMLYGVRVPRVTGVDLMERVLEALPAKSLTVCLIGGKPKVADRLVECYSQRKKYIHFVGTSGYTDVFHPKKDEENELTGIVSSARPYISFIAFGSPQQEIWIERHSRLFKNSIVMGVGGAFDFLGGTIPRAPVWMRQFGLEWLYRLYKEPWRIRRQWKLPVFFCYILYYKVVLLLRGNR